MRPIYVLILRYTANLTSLSECIQLREVSISCPYTNSIAALLHTIRSPHLKRFAVHFRLWSSRRSIQEEDASVWKKMDNELRAAYDQWAIRVTGTIEVTFHVPRDMSGYSLESCKGDLKKSFPRFTEKVAVAVVC